MDYLFKLSLLLFLFVLRNSQLSHFRKTFDERKVIKEDFSSVSLCVCVCVCMHNQYLSTDSWKQKKVGLLNFPFDLCLPVCPLLLWLKFWLTRKILYSWIIDKWLSRDIAAFSFTGLPRSPVQDQVSSYEKMKIWMSTYKRKDQFTVWHSLSHRGSWPQKWSHLLLKRIEIYTFLPVTDSFLSKRLKKVSWNFINDWCWEKWTVTYKRIELNISSDRIQK